MNFRNFALAVPLAMLAAPVSAEVIAMGENSFVTRDTALVEADTKQVWLTLIKPAQWWNSAHSWSGDAANMTLRPQAGGCFCEKIPEDPDPERITLEGSVEHMRVIQAFPERALRMRGGLGPLQSEPATGVLTIAMSQTDEGTRIVWEYVVGGPMRFETPVIAKAVDGVMTQQLNGLAALLGRIDEPEPEAAAEPEAVPEAEAVTEQEDAVEPDEASTSVDEAFSDLKED